MKERIWTDIEILRKTAPLVHNITNFVVMNNTANALLACGGSPIMAHACEEVDEMIQICGATVINIGTLDATTVPAMEQALVAAKRLGKPAVLDPVGAGATTFRNEVLHRLLETAPPAFIRGNASEIMSLAGSNVVTKGVDSTESSLNSLAPARGLSQQYGCVVCVSGGVDLVVCGAQTAYLHNGSPMMEKVTGMGCTASAILGAFAAVVPDRFEAAVAATAFMGVCGEIAAERSAGPGTLQLNILDVFYTLSREQFLERVTIEIK